MTAVTPSQIPSSIQTLEQLHAWTAYAMAYINSQTQLFESETEKVLAAQVNVYPVNVPQGNIAGGAIVRDYRMVIRTGLAVSADQLTGDLPPWMYVLPLSAAALPSTFSS
jgi:hypothetical protein